jgi:hypothetical protein
MGLRKVLLQAETSDTEHACASSSSAICGGPPCAAVSAATFLNRLLEPRIADGGVDSGGADVGVADELSNHGGVGAGVGEVCAEGVPEDLG